MTEVRIEPGTVWDETDADLGTIWNATDGVESFAGDLESANYSAAFLTPTVLPTVTRFDIHVVARAVSTSPVELLCSVYGLAVGAGGGPNPLRGVAQSSTTSLPGDGVKRERVMTVTPDDAYSAGWDALVEQFAGTPAVEVYAYLSPDVWELWIDQVWLIAYADTFTPAPPWRQFPRNDGLAAGSLRRALPRPKSVQRGGRPGPGAYL